MAPRRPVTAAKGTRRARKSATSHRAREKMAAAARARRRAEQQVRAQTLAQQQAFLTAYANVGVITAAAKLVEIDRKRHYEWLADPKKYPTYRAAFADAHEQAADRLEAEMFRRGVQGVEKPVFGKLPGKDTGSGKIGTIPEYSDRMLELLIKARRPERFRERFEHTGAGGAPLPPPGPAVAFYAMPDNRRPRRQGARP